MYNFVNRPAGRGGGGLETEGEGRESFGWELSSELAEGII